MIEDFMTVWRTYSRALFQDWELKALVSLIMTTISSFTGLSLVISHVFLAVLFFDFLLGVACSLKFHSFSYFKFKMGISKIVVYVFYVILVSWGDKVFQEIFLFPSEKHYLAMWLAGTIIFTELISILGHCKMLGLPVPESMSFMLKKARQSLDSSTLNFMENKENNKRIELED